MASIIFEQHANPFFSISNPSATLNELSDAAGQLMPAVIELSPRNVQTDQPVEINFRWKQVGFLTQFPLPFLEFSLEFYLEKVGSGEVTALEDFQKTVSYVTGVNHVYNEKITIPANSIQKGNYKCVAVFKLGFTGSAPDDTPFAGFAEFPYVNFYKSTI